MDNQLESIRGNLPESSQEVTECIYSEAENVSSYEESYTAQANLPRCVIPASYRILLLLYICSILYFDNWMHVIFFIQV